MIRKVKLCECGCNEPVSSTENRFIKGHHLRLAEFRVKEFSKESLKKRGDAIKEYWRTHTNPKKGTILYKGKFIKKEVVEFPLCKCGCGERVEKVRNKYIHGHNGRGKSNQKGQIPWNKGKKGLQVAWNKGTGKVKVPIPCKCGCEEITSPGAVYISGHNQRGIKQSKKSIAKRVKKNSGQKRPDGNWNPWSKGLTKKKSSILRKMAAKTSKTMKKKFLDPKFCDRWLKSHSISPNNLEIEIDKLLQRLFPKEYKFVGDFQFFLGGRNPDFMNINGQKKLIEIFGDYYHSEEIIGLSKDDHEKERKKHFKKYGFDTLVLWESQIKKSIKRTENRIKAFHLR